MLKKGISDLRSGIAAKFLGLALAMAPDHEKGDLAKAIQGFLLTH